MRVLIVALAFQVAASLTPRAAQASAQTTTPTAPPPAQSQPDPSQTTQPAAEQPAPTTDISRIPLSLDRIREGVQREPRLRLDFLDPDIPIYRIEVQERALTLEDLWKVRDTAVWKGVGTSFGSAWHHDFLSMVTPKQQIAASPFGIFGNPIHPAGLPILAIGAGIKSAWQNRQRARIRRQVQEELRALEASRPAAPPASAASPSAASPSSGDAASPTGTENKKTDPAEEKPAAPPSSSAPSPTPPPGKTPPL